jgi:hypothetical protein
MEVMRGKGFRLVETRANRLDQSSWIQQIECRMGIILDSRR